MTENQKNEINCNNSRKKSGRYKHKFKYRISHGVPIRAKPIYSWKIRI